MIRFSAWVMICAVAAPLLAADPHAHHQHGAPGGVSAGVAAAPVDPSPPPAGFEQVDHEVTIGVVPNQMKYDRELFTVRPGAKVKLTLVNTDIMQHNLLICAPAPGLSGDDTVTQVAMKAWELGADGFTKQFIPDTPLVLHATKLLDPNRAQSIYFTAPAQPGAYPYVCTMPGHAFTMKGVMAVSAHAPGIGYDGKEKGMPGITDYTWKQYEGTWERLPDFTALEPVRQGTARGRINFKGKVANGFGYVFEAPLSVPFQGEYTFYLSSDDGSRLLINGKPVVTYDGIHAADREKTGTVTLTPGTHDLRIEYFEKAGQEELAVAWSGPHIAKRYFTPDRKRDEIDDRFTLAVHDQPRLKRCLLPDASSRSIAVGLPGGINYCFDAQTCTVRYGWFGGFINMGPEIGNLTGRGGQVVKLLGKRFNVGATERFPLRIGTSQTPPEVEFLGYRSEPLPQFIYSIDGHTVKQTIDAVSGKMGLRYTFEFVSPPGDTVTFAADPAGLNLTSSAGTWQAGKLTVPAADAAKFTVTIVNN